MAKKKTAATDAAAFGKVREVIVIPPAGTGTRGRIGGISPKASRAYQKMREQFQARISKGFRRIDLPG